MVNKAHENNPIQCPYCPKIAKNQFGLEGHIRFSHRDIAQKQQSNEQTQPEQLIEPLEADNQEFISVQQQTALNQPQPVKQPLNAPQQQSAYPQPYQYPIIYNPQFPPHVQQQLQRQQQIITAPQPLQQLPRQPIKQSPEWQLDNDEFDEREEKQAFDRLPKKAKTDGFDKLICFLIGLAFGLIAMGFWLYFYIQRQINAITLPGMPG